MKKIGLITYHSYNYGSLLQCYSTKHFLESNGFYCEVIDLDYSEISLNQRINSLFGHLRRTIKYPGYIKYMVDKKYNSNKDICSITNNTIEFMVDFEKRIISPKSYSWEKIKKIQKEYSYFVVGSDQVWNTTNSINPLFFLTFAEKNKRVSLAPSFGTDTIPKWYRNDLVKGLRGFSKISVREESGVQIVKKLTGMDAIRLADPVVLHNKKEWLSFCEEGIQREGNYIFVHFLNKPSRDQLNYIQRLSLINKKEIVCFSNQYDEYKAFGNYKMVSGSPYDYVSLINCAYLVITDSFHSTLFSLIMETQFLVLPRQYSHKYSQQTRLLNLLKRHGFINRFISNYELDIDANKLPVWNSDEIFDDERSLIKNYLIKELNK